MTLETFLHVQHTLKNVHIRSCGTREHSLGDQVRKSVNKMAGSQLEVKATEIPQFKVFYESRIDQTVGGGRLL